MEAPIVGSLLTVTANAVLLQRHRKDVPYDSEKVGSPRGREVNMRKLNKTFGPVLLWLPMTVAVMGCPTRDQFPSGADGGAGAAGSTAIGGHSGAGGSAGGAAGA